MVLSSWTRALVASLNALKELADNNSYKLYDELNLAGSVNNDLSLVFCKRAEHEGAEACLVSWTTRPFRRSGRIVSLDDTDSIIYPSHFVEKTSLDKFYMIWPSIGARVRKRNRETVSTSVLRMQEIYNTSSDGGQGFDLSLSPLKCVACSLQHDGSGSDQAIQQTGILKCAFCLQNFHQDCGLQLARFLPTFEQTTPIQSFRDLDMDVGDIPLVLVFASQVCLCHIILS